ncbi:MAG: hypothetical protein WBB82_05940 [Limnothrix sp.]
MKSRDLNTIHDLIVTDYKIEPIGDGKFRHSFHPKTTNTIYEFVANGSPEVEEAQRYNIGYTVTSDGRNIIDMSCLSKNNEVNTMLSYLHAQSMSRNKHSINKKKNDDRVAYDKSQGYFWGPKYAWREYGLAIPQSAFRAYVEEIQHPSIQCVITNPDKPRQTTKTVAYADTGLEEAIEQLIQTAEKISNVHFKSPLYPQKFTIKGIDAITDKK